MKYFFTIGCLLILALNSKAQIHDFNLQECIDYAMEHQISLKNAELDKELQFEKNKEVLASTRPNVSANADMNYLFIIPKQRSDAGAFNFGDAFSFFVVDSAAYQQFLNTPQPEYSELKFGLPLSMSANVQASQILFDPNVLIGLQARESLNELAELNLQRTKEDLRVSVSKAYYNAVIAERRSILLDENISLLTSLEDMTSRLYKEGFAEKIDWTRLTVQKNNAISEKEKIMGLIELSKQLLKFQIGMPLDESLEVIDNLTREVIEENLVLDNVVDYGNRTEFKLLEKAVELNDLDLQRYEKSYLPSVVAVGQLGYATQTKRLQEFFTLPWFPTGAIGLSVSVPIYGGGLRAAKMNQAKINIQKNQNDMLNLKHVVDLQAANSRTMLSNNLITLKRQEETINLAEKVLDLSKRKYKEGVGSNIEIIQAQTELKTARINFYNTLYEAMLSKIDLEQALGVYK